MKTASNTAKVLPVEPIEPAAPNGVVIAGQMIEVGQNHLLPPFAALLAAVEKMALVAAGGCAQRAGDEEACVATAYRALYDFFRALLPSASHEGIDGLTYSVSLLLVGEAIETSRVVVAGPARTGRSERPEARGERPEARGERPEARSEIQSSAFLLPPSSFTTGRPL